MNFLTKSFSTLPIIFITVPILFFPLTFAYTDEIERVPEDPAMSEICTISDCNPARSCAGESESCYTINGVFYCCIEPPSGGVEAVGE